MYNNICAVAAVPTLRELSNIRTPTDRRCQEINKNVQTVYVCFVCVFACSVYTYMCMGVHFSVHRNEILVSVYRYGKQVNVLPSKNQAQLMSANN